MDELEPLAEVEEEVVEQLLEEVALHSYDHSVVSQRSDSIFECCT